MLDRISPSVTQDTTDAYAMAGRVLGAGPNGDYPGMDCTGAINFALVNHDAAHTVAWKLQGCNDDITRDTPLWVDIAAVTGFPAPSGTLAASSTATYVEDHAHYPYYRLMVKSAVNGASASVTVSAAAKE